MTAAGPVLAEPSGPPDTRPPTRPSSPPPPKQALAEIDGLLLSALALVGTLPATADRVEVCGQEIARHRLRMARKAVADLLAYTQTPARQCLSSAAAVAGGPVKSLAPTDFRAAGSKAALPRADRAGSPPAPGAGFSLPPIQTVPSFDNGPEFAVGTALLAAINRRAD